MPSAKKTKEKAQTDVANADYKDLALGNSSDIIVAPLVAGGVAFVLTLLLLRLIYQPSANVSKKK